MKTKRLFALLLTLAMVLSFAACGGKEKEPGSTEQGNQTSQAEQTEPAKTYTELKMGDEGVGAFDASTLCADFSIPDGVKYKVSSYEVDLSIHRYSFRMQLGKSSPYYYPYLLEIGNSYNQTLDEEVEAFIKTNTVGDIVAEATDDMTVGDKVLKGVHVSSNLNDDIDYYLYVFNSAQTNANMKLIFQVNKNFNGYTADDDADMFSIIESIVLK